MTQTIKRFYEIASVSHIDNAYQVLLDDKPLNTPSRTTLTIPNKNLAQSVCDEWNKQDDVVNPVSMPIYSILVTAMDKSNEHDRQGIMAELTPYIDGDLVFYHAPDPIGLTHYQADLWGNAIDLFEQKYNVRPDITHDLTALRQSPQYHDVVVRHIQSLADIEFTIFHILVSLGGSPLLACLATQGIYTADEIMKIVNAEQDFYHKHYKFKDDDIGPDERQKSECMKRDIISCMDILSSIKN